MKTSPKYNNDEIKRRIFFQIKQFKLQIKNITQNNRSMQLSESKFISKVSGATVHKLSKDSRTKLAEGSCTIYDETDNKMFKVNTFVRNLKDMTFGEVKYSKSNSYFFEEGAQIGFIHVLSVSVDTNSEELLKQFRDSLDKFATVKQLLNEENESQLHKKVIEAYPDLATKEVKSKSAISKISKKFGSLIGMISGMVEKPVDKASLVFEDKKQNFYEHNINPEAKSQWNVLKQNAASINQSVTESFKPVSNGAKNISNSIGHSFNHSNNSFIKAIREISKKTKDALNEGYKQATGQVQVLKPLPAESDSVMEIKVENANKQTANVAS